MKILVKQILDLHEKKRAIEAEIRNAYSNASDDGYDSSALRSSIDELLTNVQTEDESDNQEADDKFDSYLDHLDIYRK